MGNICINYILTEQPIHVTEHKEESHTQKEVEKIQKSQKLSQEEEIENSIENMNNSDADCEINENPGSTKEDINANIIEPSANEIEENEFNQQMALTKTQENNEPTLLNLQPKSFVCQQENPFNNFFVPDFNFEQKSKDVYVKKDMNHDSDVLTKILFIQNCYKSYLIRKKEKYYNAIKSIKTSLQSKVDPRLYGVFEHLRGDYVIIRPFGMKKHSKEGYCHLVWKDGSYLKGIYKKNKLNGYCRVFLKDRTEYRGSFVNNLFDGFGIYYSSDDTKIQGYFKEGKINGIAIEKFKDGTVYKGEYRDGLRNGIGTYIYNDGSVFCGMFKDHKINGFGIIDYADRRHYEGEFKDNLFEGYGEFIWENGEKYLGYWREGKKDFFGVYINKNKRNSYIGFWRGNKQHGIGAVYSDFGVRFGEWERGKKVQKLPDYETAMKMIDASNEKYKKFFYKTREAAASLFADL